MEGTWEVESASEACIGFSKDRPFRWSVLHFPHFQCVVLLVVVALIEKVTPRK